MEMEMILGAVAVAFCSIILTTIFVSCFWYHREIKMERAREKYYESQPTTREISFSEVVKWAREIYKEPEEEKSMEEIFLDWLAKEDKGYDLTKTSDPYVQVEAPCVGNECAQSPAREDCCTGDYDNGKCKVVININKLCGIDDVIQRDPKLITPSEAEMLSKALTSYFEVMNGSK